MSFDTIQLTTLRAIMPSALDKEPLTSEIDVKVISGRTVLAYAGGAFEDRRMKVVWDNYLRPRKSVRPEITVVYDARPASINWQSKSASLYDVDGARSQLRTLHEELDSLIEDEGKCALRLSPDARNWEGENSFDPDVKKKRRLVSFTSIQEMERAEQELRDVRSALGRVRGDYAALKWLLEHLPKKDAKTARLPVVVPAQTGRTLRTYGVPTQGEIAGLLRRIPEKDRQNAKAWASLFVVAPERSVTTIDGQITPTPMSEEDAKPLVAWYRSGSRTMPPNILEVWSWYGLTVAWNGCHMGQTVKFPKGLHMPTADKKPSGTERANRKLATTSLQMEHVLSLVSSLMEGQQQPRLNPVPTAGSVDWWTSWENSLSWVPTALQAFNKPKYHKNPRFCFLLDKNGKALQWEEFSHVLSEFKWTRAAAVAYRYLTVLCQFYSGLRTDEEINSLLSKWTSGGNSVAKIVAPEDLGHTVIGVDNTGLYCPVVYSFEDGKAGLWPALILATGLSSPAASSYHVVPVKEYPEIVGRTLTGLIASGGENWPLDKTYEATSTVCDEFARLSEMAKEQSSAAREKQAKRDALLVSLRAQLKTETTAFRRAALSLTIGDISDAPYELTLEEEDAREMFSRRLNELGGVAEQPEMSAPDVEPVSEVVPTVAPEEIQVPETIEIHGVRYVRVGDWEDVDDTPAGVVMPVIKRFGELFAAERFMRAPHVKGSITSVVSKGVTHEIFDVNHPVKGQTKPTVKVQAVKPAPAKPVKAPKPDKGKGKQEDVPSTAVEPEIPGDSPKVVLPKGQTKVEPEKPKKVRPSKVIPPKFPGRGKETQMAGCTCTLYPCAHTKSHIVAWHVKAKLHLQERPVDSETIGAWETPELDWPDSFLKTVPGPKKDILETKNPLKVEGLKRSHEDRLDPDLLKAARKALGLTEALPANFRDLTKEERKDALEKHRLKRWVSAALSVDPANLEKIVAGTMTAKNAPSGLQRKATPTKDNVSSEPKESMAISQPGKAWKALATRFNGTSLWMNPATREEKQFKAAFDDLRNKVPEAKRKMLPKLRKRPANLGKSERRPPASGGSPLGGGIQDLLTMAQALGQIVRALKV